MAKWSQVRGQTKNVSVPGRVCHGDRGSTLFFSGVTQGERRRADVRGRGKTLDRCGKPKWVVWVNWEHLEDSPVCEVFNSHLRRSFSDIPVEVGGIEPK